MYKYTYIFLSSLFTFFSHQIVYGQVSLEKIDINWHILVEGKPYEVKGVTFGYDDDIKNYKNHFKELQFLGVNTIRTWATGDNTKLLLDEAQEHGIKVMLGIWMRHGRPGMEDDDSFDYLNDSQGKEAMYDNAIEVVKQYKNHPAVLAWGVGNEVYLNTATDEEKIVYSQLLERICSAIKLEDPKHLIGSVEAWTFGLAWWQKYVPSLDFYGLNAYGAGANFLQTELDKRSIDMPYLITEFGVTGEWDIQAEKNGVLIEPTDQEKYDAIVNGYTNWIINKPNNLGVFNFHYASSDDFMGPWLLTHYKQATRPQYWAIREAYTGEKAINEVPQIEMGDFPETIFESGQWVPVELEVLDAENDSLVIDFSYNQRTGSRKRKNQILPLVYRGNLTNGIEIQLPKVDGPVKIYAEVRDAYGNMGIASTGIQVHDEEEAQRQFLVPKVKLPFYVYQDGMNSPYAASAYMGNYDAMTVETQSKDQVFSGEASLKISYNQGYDWFGLGLVDPANDWGDILGGYDISGAKKFSFWAKASSNEVWATIGFGLIGKDKTFPDSTKESVKVKLGKEWKQYSISTKKLNLSCIRSGLTIFSSGSGIGIDIFIDEVKFE